MTDDTTGAETPAGEEAIAETPEVASPESTPEQDAPDNAETGTDEAAAPRKKPGVHNRIDELTRQKHDAIRDRDYWRQKAQELSSKTDEYADYDDQLVSKVQAAGANDRADAAERTAQMAVELQFSELENEARSRWTDYDVVARNPNVPITADMAEIIKESELGPDLAYHFGKNPAEAARLAQLSGKSLAREIGRLEARLSAPKASAKVPSAPVRPINGIAAGGSKDPGAMSMAEYAAWRKANP